MESDDVALPDRLALTLEWAQSHDLDVCGAQGEIFGGESPSSLWFPESREAVHRELLFRCALLHSSTMVRAAVLKENHYAPSCIFDDYELWTRLAPHHRLGNAPQIVVRYRRHEGQTSAVRKAEVGRDFQKYRFRYFYATHPGTPLADYLPLARLSDRAPLRSMTELEQAGEWLVRLARCPDAGVAAAMARRWRQACDRSTALGDGVDAIRRRYEARIGGGGADGAD
jgi:hypothetical protein